MAIMWPVIIKNLGLADVFVEDIGINIPAESQVTLSNQFTYEECASSDDLRGFVGDETLVCNDGTYDLSAVNGVEYLTFVHAKFLLDQRYTLDEVYDETGSGAGRLITVDSGSVKLDSTSGTYSPLELTQQTELPVTDLAAGQLSVVGGILYSYDGIRNKWLSVNRHYLTFSRGGASKNQYLNISGGLPSNNSGLRVPRNATIVALSGELDLSGTCDISLRKNDSVTNLVTLSITSSLGDQSITTDLNISVGDFLQAYISANSPVQDPVFIVELAYR